MLAFRSEEHLDRWVAMGKPSGATMTIDQQWALAKVWFEGRASPGWSKRTPAEAEAVFRSVGLTGGFWSLT